MKKAFSYLLFVALLFPVVMLTQEVYGQLGYVNGTVVDADGNPLPDVQIRIEGMNISRKYKLKTNKKGEYLHAGVSIQGIYRVIAEKKGYVTEYVENIKPGFSRDDERSTINFTMRPGEAPATLAFELTDEEREKLRQEQEEAKKRQERLEAVREVFQQGIDAYNAGNYDMAVASFLEVVKTDPEQPAVWGNLGNCYSKLEQYDKALDAYDKAISLDPENSVYLQNKGSVYSALGETEKARELYEQAAAASATLNPKDAAINYYNMGVTYINAGKNEEAAEALLKALEADPTHAESNYQLGITMLGLGKTEDAIRYLKKYVELSPTSENAEVAKALIEQLGG